MMTFTSGPDAYLVRATVTASLGHATVLDMTLQDARTELERLLKYPSFFGEVSRVIIRNVLADADTSAAVHDILERLDAVSAGHLIVAACQEGPGGRASTAASTLTAYLKKHAGEFRELPGLTGTARVRWAQDFCAARNCSLATDASALVIHRTAGDTWALANELEKLCAYAQGETVTSAMVRSLTPDRQDRDEFALSNALMSVNKRAALAALWSRLSEGAPEQLLLGAVAYSVRTLLTRHPQERLYATHRALAQLDRDAKDGIADMTDGLFAVILEL